ncbi:uncharacterized protein LOC132306541 [Cornus florida]|uniref:uncharacterized protein LOC132306541 n=1 Tax=Cornus florida TaxID=4283 RepID=UPI00289862E4|nr:uncharacterized protein LOC132306541 [Cornus florida]
MLENPTDSSSTANITTIKRYAPPNQRNRSLGRRKSGGDRFERANNIYANDEKNQCASSKNAPIVDQGDAGSSILVNENPRTGLIPLQGCCNSEAFQLMNDRWLAAMNSYNNPSTDLAEKPVMYSGSGASAWGHFRLPHQFIPPTASVGPSSGSQMDFLSELRRAMRNANATPDI